jgi:hypothetical protein
MNIHSFVNKYYNIIYTGQEVDRNNLDSVKEFLLVDNHSLAGFSIINSLFINAFAQKKDLVMVEAIASMKKCQSQDALQAVWLKEALKIVGWDIGKVGEIMSSCLAQESGDLAIQEEVLIKQWMDQKSEIDKKETEEKLITIYREKLILLPKLIAANAELWEVMAKTFKERIKSMESSLLATTQLASSIFVIAGEYHLKPRQFNDPRFSLDDFYKFLQSRNVVILYPKLELVELEKERNPILRQTLLLKTLAIDPCITNNKC